MKKSFIRFTVILLALTIVAPSVLSIVSFAADTSGGDENVWDTLDPQYTTTAVFNTVEERVAGDDIITPMNLSLVSNGYALYSDPLTGEVICLKLAPPDENGEYAVDEKGVYKYVGYYCTNPYLLSQSKTAAKATDKPTDSSVATKRTLLSQLLVKYTENTTSVTLESYANSAMFDQITTKQIRGGLRVEYTIGREETSYLVPRQIRFDKWMNLLIQIAENSTIPKDKRTFFSYYTMRALSVEQLTSWGNSFDRSTISAATEEYLFISRKAYNEKYKDDKSKAGSFTVYAGVYTGFLEAQGDKSDKTLEEIEKNYPCTKSFAIMVFEGTAKAAELRRVEQFVKLHTDYTKERLDEDHNETDYQANDKIPALFKMAIEYTLDEDGLFICLNAGNVRFDSSNYTLDSITFLPYAGAANTNNGGYIFSPDGSGTIFDLKAIKTTQFTTTSNIYGPDYAYHSITGANKEVMRFPAYGAVETIVTSVEYTEEEVTLDENGEEVIVEVTKTIDTGTNYGYLAVITSGETLAKLTVSNGGSLHMFASAYTTFNPRPSDTYNLDSGISAGTNAMWTVESKRRYTGDYGIRVFILDSENASYSGMANIYRSYLEEKGVLTPLEEEGSENIPLYIKTLGALETTKTVLGIPVDTTIALTSFEKTIEMLETLKKQKIDNVKLIMEGWCNEGMFSLVPTQIDICEALGGASKFKELVAYANNPENGSIQLFPDLDFMFAIRDDLFDGFDPGEDLAKTIDDRGASKKQYDAIYQGYGRTGMGIISPAVIEKFYAKTYAEYSKYNVGGIAVGTMGETLSSDFNEDDPLNREDSKKIVVRLLKKINEQNGKVLASAGNAYTWEHLTDIIDVPLDDSRYKYTAAAVPFYGMLVHGSIEFAGTAINLAGDYRYQLLKTIESGASPMFIIAIENTAELKQYASTWLLEDFYSVKYSIWILDMLKTYRELNDALKGVRYSKIIDHTFIDDARKVAKVTYDNGTVFFINYLLDDYKMDYGDGRITIPANSFIKTTVAEGEVNQ